ncbi:hypothetical protein RI129_004144 [Pyrocoelia pectoralis]|uniref:Uncharacterized protein n=1 Tax=Pyrocoelia pectoralis TaxID=417401 RepID=A0AAN7ZGK5_9COLE
MFQQLLRRSLRKALGSLVNSPKLRTSFAQYSRITVCGLAYANTVPFEHKEYENDLKRASKEGENYLSQLVCMLRTLILETSIQYQECLIKQIELTKENTIIGPVGEHWDRLIEVRIKGNELKEELCKYEALAKNFEDIIVEHGDMITFTRDMSLEKLNLELDKLRRLRDRQLDEIRRCEKELLDANCDSILTTKT